MANRQEYIYNEHDQSQVQEVLRGRRKRKRKKARRRILFVLVLLLIGVYFVTDLSKVQSIDIKGNTRVLVEDIKAASGAKEHSSFYLFQSTAKIKQKLEKVPGIKEAKVSKDMCGNISIMIKETTLIAYSKIGEDTYVIDEKGKVTINTSPEVLSEVQRCSQIFDMDMEVLKTFVKEYKKIPSQVRNQVSEIWFSPQNGDASRCQFNMDDGKILYLRIESMAKQLGNDRYSKVIKQLPDSKHYDFVGDKVYTDD